MCRPAPVDMKPSETRKRLLLAESDRRACVRGYDAPTLDEAIAILRALAAEDEPGAPSGDDFP